MPQEKKILMTAPQEKETALALQAYAGERGFDLTLLSTPPASAAETIAAVKGNAYLLVGGESYDATVLPKLQDTLKMICRFGAGYDSVDTAYCKMAGIEVANAPGGNAGAVADWTLSSMLALGRRRAVLDREVREGIFNPWMSADQLEGKTVGIIGFGRIGKKVAQYLSGFQTVTLVCDDYVSDEEIAAYGASRQTLSALLAKSDYVTVHTLLTEETRQMADETFFHRMKTGAYFINASRGAVVKEAALLEALQSGKLSGAALDVFEEEPIRPDHPFIKMDQLLLSPHTAFNTRDANLQTGKIAIDNFVEFDATNQCTNSVL